MTIANYIAGARGIFEYIRYDQAKPGILRTLGPIANDAIGGLIAGVSSKIYSDALELDNKKQG
jgi:phosphatidylglycerophosphatase A